ncbi:arginase [Halovivax ruber XH-70]|uniref:Arginase n=1 Tax=Halovivax ruber (strain DSM 18193 / JCM 13892 / XH-70) TaxID=797302 RepID=L0IBC2_HALRX|nr:arginase [Halovivax ruber]AGB16059.1 arginase [Halovivax ruber XH-70]
MSRTVRIIGAPVDYGANRRGVDMGPSAIRYAGLAETLAAAGIEARDDGDLFVPRAEERDPDAGTLDHENAKFIDEVQRACEHLGDRIEETLAEGEFPLVLGGDHSISIGTMHGASRDADLGVVWFDAHADLNTPSTSPSGNVHGMPLAAALGYDEFADWDWANAPNVREESVAYVGLRSVDEKEREAIRDSEMTAFTMADIDERGITAVVEDALAAATEGTDGLHVSLDLDWLDPSAAPGVGTPVRGGVTYREAHSALEVVAEHAEAHDSLRSMDVVEVNPILDESNETASVATEIVASAFGKRTI